MDKAWITCAIALGSNLGDRAAHIRGAIDAISATDAVRALRASTLHETDPVGPVEQGRFLNAALVLETALAPRELLERLQAIERAAGRERSPRQRWGPRTLDLDLLLYADAVIDEPGLRVPHPRLHERRFVLAPLAEIAPSLVVPGEARTVRDLLATLDPGGVV